MAMNDLGESEYCQNLLLGQVHTASSSMLLDLGTLRSLGTHLAPQWATPQAA